MKTVSITAFGEILQIFREQNKETAAIMAKKLGVSTPFLAQVENGKARAPHSWIAKLKKLYKCDYIDIERAIEESKSSITIDLRNANTEQRRAAIAFIRHWPKLTDEEAERILAILGNTTDQISSSPDGA